MNNSARAAVVGAVVAVLGTATTMMLNKTVSSGDDITAVTVELPTVAQLTVELPEMELSKMEMPAMELPTVELPSGSNIDSAAPENITLGQTDAIDSLDAAPEPVALHALKLEHAAVPALIGDYFSRYAASRKEQYELLNDKRSLEYDCELGKPDSGIWAKWAKIFIEPEILNYVPEFKPLRHGLKVISELRCPRSSEEMSVLAVRLSEYRQKNFNAVLVCFDTTEDLSRLVAAVDYVRSTGMKVIIVYVGGKESLHEPVFRDPDKIAEFFTRLAPRAEAMLTGHWRTSIHLYLPDKAYTNYIIKCARKANPEIGIIGQAYWGQTAETGPEIKNFKTTVNMPENASAVLITGLGYPGAASRDMLRKVFPSVADHPHKIAFVVGERAYFLSSHPTRRSRIFNELVKRQLERRLIKAGCQSTITFSADGSNRAPYSENLCQKLP